MIYLSPLLGFCGKASEAVSRLEGRYSFFGLWFRKMHLSNITCFEPLQQSFYEGTPSKGEIPFRHLLEGIQPKLQGLDPSVNECYSLNYLKLVNL